MAGIFGFFDYSKPGKGVYKNEPKRSRFAHFWVLLGRKFWQLVQVNMLYVIFCIPIVTIGPATAGLVYILRQFANERPVFLVSDFWDNFRQNWKQSFVFSLIQAAFIFLMSTSFQFYFYNAREHTWMYALLGLCVVISLLGLFASFYVYLMIVTLDLKLFAIVKNAFIFAVLCLKTNFITLLFVMLSFGLTVLFWPVTVILVICINLALAGFIICYNSYQYIHKYAVEPYLESLREQEGPSAQDDPEEGVFSDEIKKFNDRD